MAKRKGETKIDWAILVTQSKPKLWNFEPPEIYSGGPLLGKVFEFKMAQQKGETSISRGSLVADPELNSGI